MPRRALLATLMTLAAASAPAAVGEHLATGVTRWYADAPAREAAPPSLALLPGVAPTGAATLTGVPLEFTRLQGRAAVRVPIDAQTDLYGTGEVFGPLRRNGMKTVCWNTDSYAYGRSNLSLYQSHPWVLAVRGDGSSFGILADTTYRCLIDLTDGILMASDGPAFPVVVIEGATPQEVLTRLAGIIGTIAPPPRWALGYHQCRYSYAPDSRVLEIARTFREKKIPCDVVWWDIDYMDAYKSFTFHPHDFPDPRGLNDALHALDFRSIAIIDPGIKQEPGYRVYDTGNAIDAWVQDRWGNPFVGKVWPGECVFPDFTRADVRRWWSGLYWEFLDSGLDGIWNDMNEPAVFESPGWTMPGTNVHRADAELGGPSTHLRYHNVYGMLMAQATYQGVAAARPDVRPFVLTRANFIGGQRWAATWTGDNVASWEHLDASIAMVLNLGLSGQPFAGPDIGGFCEAGDGEMFARWMGFGALFPFARGHTGKGNIDKEPWAFSAKAEATSRRALEGRYRLLPYLYTVFREAWTTGLPVWRPLFFADPTDRALRAVDDAWLIGADLMVVARTSKDDASAPALPRGAWAEVTDRIYGTDDDPDLPRLYLREGAALPLGPVVQSTAAPLTEITVLANPDASGRAVGTWYDDAGEGHRHRDGDFGVWELGVDGGELATVRREGDRGWDGAFRLRVVEP
ncbi:MAG TPA: glycoside hydrolase family 31 protein [Candidatus Krumholzibacteria bacterium]|nr:glycoside hydrolase family 31 protein [Candidatus Krumholzibacteria bacterium]HRX51882.1 glycoside hydrolase family 31 protein [Candidatus Krumholzibacteria bacterium]